MKTIIDVTIVDACEEDVELVGAIVRKTLPDNPVLVHDQDVIVKALNPLPGETLLAKYWAAKEMAETVCMDAPLFYFLEREENYLVQVLKKEWFK